MIALLLTLGCGTTSEPGTEGPTARAAEDPAVLTDPDAPFLSDPTADPVEVDMVALSASVDTAIQYALQLDPAPLLEAYRGAMQGADSACPTLYQDPDFEFWLDTCTASSGAIFEGYGIDDELIGIDLGDGLVSDLVTAGGVSSVVGASGHIVEINGFVQSLNQRSVDGLVTVDVDFLQGEFYTDDPVADGTWLADGVQPDVSITRYAVGGSKAAIVSGVLQGLPGATPTVVFDEAVIGDLTLGLTDCDLEPSGTVSVQLQDGEWVDVLFDPRVEGEVVVTDVAAACDGCGQAWHLTEDLGQACFDFSPWLD